MGGAVVVRGLPGRFAAVRADVVRVGGRVTRDLPIVDGVAATVTPAAARALAAEPDVVSVTADVSGHVMAYDDDLGYDPTADTGSLLDVATIIGATKAYQAGWTGKGVDVALIDTGVAPVQGLTSGNVVNGPDLSFESASTPTCATTTPTGTARTWPSIIAGRDEEEAPGRVRRAGRGSTGSPRTRG